MCSVLYTQYWPSACDIGFVSFDTNNFEHITERLTIHKYLLIDGLEINGICSAPGKQLPADTSLYHEDTESQQNPSGELWLNQHRRLSQRSPEDRA